MENLVNRIAELPSEVSAAPLYKKLEELQAKIKEEKNLHGTLEIQKLKTSTKDLNEDELKFRILRTIKRLDEAPKEKQREVFSSLLQFIEIHATKIKLGVYATNANSNDDEGRTESSQSKATGGSTAASGLLGSSNVISILEGQKNQQWSKSTVGSRTFKVGGENPKVREHRGVVVFELETYAEPKALSKSDLQQISLRFSSIGKVARATGLSWSAVQERSSPSRVWDHALKRFVKSYSS